MTKKTRYFRLIKILLIVGMIIVWWLLYNKLPALIPIHRNAQGVANGYGSKLMTLIWLPALAVVLMVFFYFLPRLDPRKKNYPAFSNAWEVLQLIILWFFTYIYFVSLYVALHPSLSIMPWILWWFGVLFFVLGVAMRYVKSNYFIGIRTPWTLENEVVRNKTHKLGSRTFMLAWIVFFVNAFWSMYFVPVFIVTILLCILIPVVYSYVIYKRLT
jgi:uncharacterized membrane protein